MLPPGKHNCRHKKRLYSRLIDQHIIIHSLVLLEPLKSDTCVQPPGCRYAIQIDVIEQALDRYAIGQWRLSA